MPKKFIIHFYGNKRKGLVHRVLQLTFDTPVRFDSIAPYTFSFYSENEKSLIDFKESISDLNGEGLVFTSLF